MEYLIEVRCLKHIYPDKTEVKICGLDFTVKKGERIVILGPNGAGKTTLLAHILGLLAPVEGSVQVMGSDPCKDFKNNRKKIGVVFQNVDEQIIGPRVYDDIAFIPRNARLKEEEVKDKVSNIAKILKIEHLLEKIPHYLSGGQKKKVALAGAIVMFPELLVLDEPFDSLDPESKKEMLGIINFLNKEYGITVIITTHDINLVPEVADRVYILNEGNIVMQGSPSEVFAESKLLKDANLEPPILSELFQRLKKRGHNIDIPGNLDEAENILDKKLKN
ncbi:MAG: ATP-binding cassette domain-containing protein [Clostridia bacterium]|nr:ATP-binding cassette domain-containing protein [Clostridia bacterium]